MIKATYTSKDEIPEKFQELYTERDGQFVLSGIEGIKTQADIDGLKATLTKVRTELTDKEKDLKKFEGINPDEVSTMKQELEEFKISGSNGKIDDDKINQIVESRLKVKIAPIERERDSLKVQLEESNTNLGTLQSEKKLNTIASSLRTAAEKVVRPEAIPDVLARSGMFELSEDGSVLTKDGCGVAPSLTPEQFIADAVKNSPHWLIPSNGAGGNPKPNGSGKPIKNDKGTFKEIVDEAFENVNK